MTTPPEPQGEPGPGSSGADWRQELERITPNLLAWAHARLRGRPAADAEDLTQEVLCRAVSRIDSFTGGNFMAWVFTIGKHVLLEHLRRQRKVGRVRLPEGHSSVYAEMGQLAADMTTLTRKVAKREDLQRLLGLLGELDEVDRSIAILCGMEGQTCRAAGVQVGMGEEAVTKRWQRLRVRLKEAATWMGE